MATLDRLLICGVRSFGPLDTDTQKIKFSPSLNLFLGQNGCGKTTIIESLKFACTGQLPPGTDSGRGFVNDPKMSNQSTTKGQVRLLVTNINGDKYTIVRSMQVTQTNKSLCFKTLDSTIKVVKSNGVESTITSRCIDVDANCVQLLGLPSSILNNVIFCHQENSTWPLDEAKKLKEKFDDIFDAVKYNKCIESMIKLRTEKRSSIKQLEIELAHKKFKKELAENERAKLNETIEKLHTLSADIIIKENTLKPILDRCKKICELEENLGNLQNRLSIKRNEKKNLINQQEGILKNIQTEFRGNDNDLKTEISNFENNRQNIITKIDDFERKLNDIETTEKELNTNIGKIQCKIALLTEEKKQLQNTVRSRNQLIEKIIGKLSLQSEVDFEQNNSVKACIVSIQDAVSAAKESVNSLTKEHELKDNDMQLMIDKAREKISEVNLNIKSKTEQNTVYKTRVRDINSQLRDLDVSDDELKNLCNKIKNVDVDLETLKARIDERVLTSNIDENKKNIRKLNEDIEELEAEYKILQQNSLIEAELEKTKRDILKRESDIHKLKNKHFENFNYLFSKGVPEENFKDSVQKYMQEASDLVNLTMNKINGKENALASLKTKHEFNEKQLKLAQNDFHVNKKKIDNICIGKNFNDYLNELNDLVEKLQRQKGEYSSEKFIYEKYINEFENNKHCPICKTNFQNKVGFVKEIVKNIKSRIEEIPSELKKVENELKEKQDQFIKMQHLKPLNDNLETTLKNTIPKLEEEVKTSKIQIERIGDELVTLKEELEDPQKKKDVCNNLITDATLIDQYMVDVTKYRSNINHLEMQMVKVASNRSRYETETEIENKKLNLKNLQQTNETIQKRLDQFNKRHHDLREERNKLIEKQLEIQKTIQSKPQLQKQFEELSQKTGNLDTEIADLKTTLIPFQKKLDAAINAKETTRKNNKEAYNKALNSYNNYVKVLEEISRLQKNIDDLIEREVDFQYEKFNQNLTDENTKKTNLAETKNKFMQKITDNKTILAEGSNVLRNLQDNLELREERKQQKTIENEIENLTNQIGNSNLVSLMNEKQELQEEKDIICREINIVKGEINQLEKSIKEARVELEKPEKKDAHKEYKHKLYELKLTEGIAQDLKLFTDALERCLIEFHKEHMKQVNKRIRELWRSIYRGNDIDYVEIKTELPQKSSERRRTYNYKVVQVKHGIELEMRGRCSAGQKVLACLIIRMALAETFSKNCGILALDEPTTNLDRENIISLSNELARIVNFRRDNNFQLLIITHDEEFLEALSHHVEGLTHYWKVTRNEDGFSIITKNTL